ncbi:MAG: molybdopterin cofactor-binding domain-containing protein, partial [Myxococcota bacterium]
MSEAEDVTPPAGPSAATGLLTRRRVLFGSAALLGGGAIFGFAWLDRDRPNPLLEHLADGEVSLNQYLKITTDNEVWVAIPRAEMGQGIMAGLAVLVAEELDVPWPDVHVFPAPTAPIYANNTTWLESLPFMPYDHSTVAEAVRGVTRWIGKVMGQDFTAASTSTRDGFEPMRKAAAATRALLVAEAAERLQADAATLVVEDRHVVEPGSARRLAFRELAEAAAERTVPPDVRLKPRAQWKLLGRSLPRQDIPAKCRGAATFTADFRAPDLLHATVRQNPNIGAPAIAVDDAETRAMPGVHSVVAHDSWVGVLGDSFWQAHRAADRLQVEWAAADYLPSSAEQRAELGRLCDAGDADVFRDDGDARAYAGAASQTLQAEYYVPNLAHMTMEPMSAAAQFTDDGLSLWVGSQAPSSVVQVVARELDLDPDTIRFHQQLIGGGFGRRAEMDFIVQAAVLARHARPRPVNLLWSREQDVTHDFYRPAMLGRFSGAVGDDGMPVALHARTASQDVMPQFVPRVTPGAIFPVDDVTSAQGIFDQSYAIPNFLSEHVAVDWPLRVGNWRSVGLFGSGFMMESFIDELARLGGKDPVDVHLHLLREHPGMARVVQAAAEMAGWGQPLPPGRGRGLSFLAPFEAYMAQVVEVSFDEREGLRVEKVFAAIDVGTAVNPGSIRAQIEGGIVFGLSAALLQRIDFADGRVVQSNFHDHDVLRMHQMPRIEVEILEEKEGIAGVGEAGTAPIGGALANAV